MILAKKSEFPEVKKPEVVGYYFDEKYETPIQRHSKKWFYEHGLPTLIKSHKLILEGTKQMGIDVFDATVVESTSPYPKVKLEEIL